MLHAKGGTITCDVQSSPAFSSTDRDMGQLAYVFSVRDDQCHRHGSMGDGGKSNTPNNIALLLLRVGKSR